MGKGWGLSHLTSSGARFLNSRLILFFISMSSCSSAPTLLPCPLLRFPLPPTLKNFKDLEMNEKKCKYKRLLSPVRCEGERIANGVQGVGTLTQLPPPPCPHTRARTHTHAHIHTHTHTLGAAVASPSMAAQRLNLHDTAPPTPWPTLLPPPERIG